MMVLSNELKAALSLSKPCSAITTRTFTVRTARPLRKPILTLAAFVALSAASALALPATDTQHWECVPIARALSGIEIRGNANTWWGQAEGRYDRGNAPKRGAVLTFKPRGAMQLGHVAAVSKIVDDRTILVTHSNWSPINGRRGQIERDVKVIDVSEAGDWSSVRVWFAPTQELGTTSYPVYGFIYPAGKAPMRLPDAGTVAAAATVKLDVPAFVPRPTGRLDYMRKMLAGLK
jgi:surface antigen